MGESQGPPAREDRFWAVSEFIRIYGDKAYNFAYRLSGNEAEAGDLVQEAFLRVFRHWDRYDSNRPFEAWFFRILHNIYLDEVRRYSRKHCVSLDAPSPATEVSWDEVLPGPDPEPVEALSRLEDDAMIQRALDSLPIQYRTAVTLCDVDGLPYERIGEIMACPVGTVRSRIHQGRRLMREAFLRLQAGKGGAA